jgi:hypothetical protein
MLMIEISQELQFMRALVKCSFQMFILTRGIILVFLTIQLKHGAAPLLLRFDVTLSNRVPGTVRLSAQKLQTVVIFTVEAD